MTTSNQKSREMCGRLGSFVLVMLLSALSLGQAARAESRLPELPLVSQLDGPGSHWTLERTVDADASLSVDDVVTLEPDSASLKLHVPSAGDGSYAEIRVAPLLVLTPGEQYVFSVWISGRASQRPHAEVYSFDRSGHPTRVETSLGPSAGHFGWKLLRMAFTVPSDSASVRLGMGIAQGNGELWFNQPQLQLADQAVEVAKKMPKASDAEVAAGQDWTAKWIWVHDDLGQRQISFNKTIVLDRKPSSAVVQITADDSYELRVNGQLVGVDTHWKSVELIDVTEYLRAGENAFEISVVNFGFIGGALMDGAAFMADRQVVHFGTDGDWVSSATAIGEATRTMVVGTPPVEPWGEMPFTRYEPPQTLRAQLLESVPAVQPGGAMRLALRLPALLDEATIARFVLSFTDVDAQRRHPLSSVPPRLMQREGNVLVVELPVSQFAAAGEYEWRLEAPGYVIAASDAAAHRVTVLKGEDLPEPAGIVWPGERVNKMTIGGRSVAPVLYSTMTHCADHFIRWQTTDAHLYEVYKTLGAMWTSPDTFDIEGLEQEIFEILDADPHASIYLKIGFDVPSWWLRTHPDDRFVSSDGWAGLQSFASDAWREDVVSATARIVEQLRQRPAGRYVTGVIPLGFRGGEFQLWGEDSAAYDVSPVAKQAFARWQREQGYADLVELPHPALKMPFEPGQANAMVRRRFFEFVADRAGGNMVYFAKQLKEKIPGISVAMYYGYLAEHAVWPQRLFFAGHLGIERVIREAPIDMLGCPASYEFRGVGEPISFMYPEGSASLHGITPLIENDIRTYRIKSDEPGAADGILTSYVDIEKLRLAAASRGAGVRYLGLFNTVDSFQSPELLHHTAMWNRKVQTLKFNPRGENGEVAMLLDPSALIGATELPGMATMVPAFLHKVRDPLARTGRPFTMLLMSDWLEHRDTWDTVVVPLPSLLDQQTRDALASAFGALPELTDADGLLVLSRNPGQAFVTSDLSELRQRLATPEAKAADPDTVWYVGGNFKARITGTDVQLHRE